MRKILIILSIVISFLAVSCNGGSSGEIGMAPAFLSEAIIDGTGIAAARITTPSEEEYGKFMYAINIPFITGMEEKAVSDKYTDTIVGTKVDVIRMKNADETITFTVTGKNIATEIVYNPTTVSFSYKQVLRGEMPDWPIVYYVTAIGDNIKYDAESDSWDGNIVTYNLMDQSSVPDPNINPNTYSYSMSSWNAYYHSDNAVTGIAICGGAGMWGLFERESPIIESVDSIDDVDVITGTWNSSTANAGGPLQLVYFNGDYNVYPMDINRPWSDIVSKAKELSSKWILPASV